MRMRYHRGFGHGLRPGTSSDITCPLCQREDAALAGLGTEAAEVYNAIAGLYNNGRTVNNSQIARMTLLTKNRVTRALDMLLEHGLIKDVGKGAAYHWRTVPLTQAGHGAR